MTKSWPWLGRFEEIGFEAFQRLEAGFGQGHGVHQYYV